MIKKLLAVFAFALSFVVFAEEERSEMKDAPALNWDAAPVDLVLQTYGEQVGKTILKDPSTPNATITLKSREGQKLSQAEYLEAIEIVLEMNGVHLEPYGESFIRALPRKDVRKEGIPLYMDVESVDLAQGQGVVVSVMLNFKHISYEEAQKALEGFKSASGILLCFERTNSILVTDTKQNIARMLEIARSIDVASPVTESVFVRQIANASAADIKTALETIVQDSQKELEKEGGKGASTRATNTATPAPGRTLLNRNNANNPSPAPVNNESLVMTVSDADRGMIRGKVLILSDERSNKLIIVTQESNMKFFDRVIEQLDVETTPDVKVEVIRLKYADAEDVSDMINDLIGNSASAKSSTKSNQNQNAKAGSSGNITRNTSTSSTSKPAANQRTGESKAGELSKDNVTVLADKRINGLVVMARAADMPVLHQIIESMDIKLSQVLIETVIIEVSLGDNLETGVDWIYGLRNNGREKQAIGSGNVSTNMFDVFSDKFVENAAAASSSGGLTYALFSEKVDIGAIIKASKSDSNSKYVASPVIMTLDNKEAVIEAKKMQYLFKGLKTNSGYSTTQDKDYEQKELGLEVKVTPKINPNGTVMLEVEEEYSQVSGTQDVEGVGKGLPTYVTRKMSADVSLENQQTVVFAGLTEKKIDESSGGIPILKDIPYIGKYLFGWTAHEESRKELLVFMTPYVMNDANEAEREAIRRKRALSDAKPWDDNGWSASKLADPVSTKEQLRRQNEEWEKEDEEYEAEKALDKAKLERAKALEERAK